MTKLPFDYIDSNICGQNRKILECYYTAERSDGGTADEVILRGLLAVLAQFGGQSIADGVPRLKPRGCLLPGACACATAPPVKPPGPGSSSGGGRPR